jgi:hypothetical protein
VTVENPAARATPWEAPPQPDNADGARRMVGVEIEFAGVPVEAAAEAARGLFGGSLRRHSPHLIDVEDTPWGAFRVEIDMNLAHKPPAEEPEQTLRDIAIGVSSVVVPTEIACPPIPWDEAHALDALRARLRGLGALGTRESLLYAFGLQLNPELPSLETPAVLDTLRAFVLLRDWLRREIDVDPCRRVWLFETPFPMGYCARVLDPAYRPDRGRFIDDYLRANPTRDREVDLLPLCKHLDEGRVTRALPHEKVNARPTWHYRLPNSEIESPFWSIGLEWSRWVRVEKLAARPDLLAAAAEEWLDNRTRLIPRSWEPRSIEIAESL